MKKVGIRILANAGYGVDQVKGITLEELKDFVEDLIAEYGEDTEIVTVDDGNHYGAKYGKLYTETIDDEYTEDDEEEY